MGESFTPNLSAGTGTFSVPIALPPGRAGVQPSLALEYGTSGGNGPLGVGWSLAAPFIARQTDRGLPRYVDASAWQPEEDRFIYNGGQELVPVDSAAAAAIDGGTIPAELAGWQQYRARVEGGFMRFFRAPDGLSWVVQDKNGTRFDFGLLDAGEGPAEAVTASSAALLSEDDDGGGRVFQWNLTRMSDAHGSSVYYLYSRNGGQRYLADIYYVSPLACAAAAPAAQRDCSQPLQTYGRRVHLVYETRDDVFSNYAPGWRIDTALRLRRVEVTAFDAGAQQRTLVRRYHLRYDPTSFISLLSEVQVEGRPQLTDAAHGPVGDRGLTEGGLGDAIVGVTLPPMGFAYSSPQHVSSNVIPGFVGLDGTVHESPSSPPHSVSEERADLFDVNSDGLPDLIVTDPARYRSADGRPAVGVFFNGFSGEDATPDVPGAFSSAVPMAIPGDESSSLNLGNLNINPMDVDGDGRSDLLHMPRLANYGFFTPARKADKQVAEASPAAQGWAFAKHSVALPRGDLDPRLDFGRDGSRIRLIDVNNDHLIDAVRTTGTEMQTFLNLGWLEGGQGRFGSAVYSGGSWQLSTEPISSCVLQLGTPIDFADPEVRLADMNGDGIQDIVALRKGRVAYWPGRGPGLWGEGASSCGRNEGDGREIDMATPPQELNAELDNVFLEDVDMDGTADVVQIRFDAVDVWYNAAGRAFTDRAILDGTPFAPGFAPRLRFADIDGSGTTDILYANADDWKWVDPMGGQRPRLLIGVENGLGGVTSLQYGSSAREYLRDLADAQSCLDSNCDRFTWNAGDQKCDAELDLVVGDSCVRSTGSPVVSSVVTAVETSDSFNLLGQPEFKKRTEYRYHDGYYEGIEQEFRGFGAADAVEIGDEAHPTSITRTYFDQGRRPGVLATNRILDNPNEALKGRSYLSEVFDLNGTYLSSSHATLNVRTLLTGLDGRAVSYAYVGRSDELRYDTGPFAPVGGQVLTLPSVVRERAGGTLTAATVTASESRPVHIRSDRYAHMLTTIDTVDNAGNMRQQTAHGRVRGEDTEPLPNEEIIGTTIPSLCNAEQWIWRTAEGYVTGHGDTTKLSHALNSYAPGTCDLLYTQTAADIPAPYDFTGQVPAESLTPSSEALEGSTKYDTWGNTTETCGGGDLRTGSTARCLRYGRIDYDQDFGQFPLAESIATGRVSGGAFTLLTTTAEWDTGLSVLLSVTDPNSLASRLTYDGLGRLRSLTPPRAANCPLNQHPLTRIDYQLADELGEPVNLVTTSTELDCNVGGPAPFVSRTLVDGLGRVRVALADAEDEANPTLASRWQRSGITRVSARGTVVEAFQPDLIAAGGSPLAALVPPSSSIPSTFAFYDAFGRTIAAVAEDGSTARTVYHALGTDVWDPNDLDPSSPDYGTPASERTDGHGRSIDQVLRNRQPGHSDIEYYRLFSDYRADGQVVQVARAQTVLDRPRALETVITRTGKPHLTSRQLIYDSAGRRIASTDPDTDSRATSKTDTDRGWRYLFNRVGDLVALRDPRGCGQNFYYDHAGRLIAEHYVACGEAQANPEHAEENVPAGAIALDELSSSTLSADARYYFDSYPSWFSASGEGFGGLASLPSSASGVLGRATAVMDRGQRSVLAYDAIGRVIHSARQLAVISDPAGLSSNTLSSPPGLVADNAGAAAFASYDTTHTYVRGASYDYASRPLTLAIEPFAGTNRRVTAAMQYNARSLPLRVDAQVSFGASANYTQAVVQRIDYTRDGLPSHVLYGNDVGGSTAAPESETFYDVRRRPERMLTLRNAGVGPSAGEIAGRPLNAVSVITDQALVWDASSNLLEVLDSRPGDEWPVGFRPASYRASHDALYRVTGVELDYTRDDGSRVPTDSYVNYRDELAQVRAADPMQPRTAPRVTSTPESRPSSLTYEYDWLANTVESTDDAYQFYERSLGRISNGFEEDDGRPSALRLATDLERNPPSFPLLSGERGGWLQVGYGDGGNVQTLTVHAQCVDKDYAASKTCHDPLLGVDARIAYLNANCTCASEQHYQYRWDELNRLSEARRYDRANGAGTYGLAARQRYRYDAGNQRVVKQTLDVLGSGEERIALEVFGGDLERRGIQRGGTVSAPTYVPASSGKQEDQYLVGGARLVWSNARGSGYAPLDADHRATIALSDLIGSSSAVIDLTSHEVVESSTYLPGGGRESFRSDGGKVGAEPDGFTGKEGEDEVGVTYFGERWLIARIGRWATPDPLSVHALGGGEFGNSYHYVGGNLLQGRDPFGLEEPDAGVEDVALPPGGLTDTTPYPNRDYGPGGSMCRVATQEDNASLLDPRRFIVNAMHSSPLANELENHYMDQVGTKFTLSVQDMVDVHANVSVLNRYREAGHQLSKNPNEFEQIRNRIAAEGGGSEDVAFTAPAEANTAGTLAHFNVHYSGRLEVSGNGEWEFKGQMSFSDIYDMNPSNYRQGPAELQVTLMRNFGPHGKDFVVDSPQVEFQQSSQDPSGRWIGAGKAQGTGQSDALKEVNNDAQSTQGDAQGDRQIQ